MAKSHSESVVLVALQIADEVQVWLIGNADQECDPGDAGRGGQEPEL